MIRAFLLVGLGGAAGSMLRFAIKLLTASIYGTLIVNVLGSFLIGLGLSAISSKDWSFLIIVGFLGGFTTFSTFSSETVTMIQNGDYLKGILYLSTTLLLCLFMTFIGILLGRLINR